MKKILFLSLCLMFATNVNSQHRHHHHHGHYWLAPALVGGIVGYALANNRVEAAPPPVVYYQNNTAPIVCPLGLNPVYSRAYLYDRWGRLVPVDNFVGCQ